MGYKPGKFIRWCGRALQAVAVPCSLVLIGYLAGLVVVSGFGLQPPEWLIICSNVLLAISCTIILALLSAVLVG